MDEQGGTFGTHVLRKGTGIFSRIEKRGIVHKKVTRA